MAGKGSKSLLKSKYVNIYKRGQIKKSAMPLTPLVLKESEFFT